jgi:hypothetical protein
MRTTLRWQHPLLQFPANIGMSDLPQAKYDKADHLTRLIHREGVDGNWSTFEIRVGTPANVFRVLPVTSWQETWVIWASAAGHCNVSAGYRQIVEMPEVVFSTITLRVRGKMAKNNFWGWMRRWDTMGRVNTVCVLNLSWGEGWVACLNKDPDEM